MHYTVCEVRLLKFSQLISQVSQDIPIKKIHSVDLFEISDVQLIDGVQSEYTNTTLYFGYLDQLSGNRLPAQCVLVQTAAAEALAGVEGDLALVEKDSLFHLVNAANTAFAASRNRGFYEELLESATKTRSLEQIINLAASRLGNSLILLDSDFKVLGHSTVFPITDPLWVENIRRGYCSYEFISAVAELDSVKNAPLTSEPVLVTCYASPLRKLSSKIFCNGRRAGAIMMLEKETPISLLHMQLLPVISAAVGETLQRFAPYLIPGNTVYQKLLYDLLIGATPEEIAPRLAGLRFSPQLCALCIQSTRYLGQRHLKEQVADKLSALLPGTRLTFHENSIAALVPLDEAPELTGEQVAALEAFAKEDFLRVGVSNIFFQIGNFAKRYTQARRVLELQKQLKTEAAVCRYSDFSFYDLLDTVKEPVTLGFFCHPALALLSRYDHANGTDLYHTLEAYLACDCSVKLAAKKLFIHRNSLSYRLERIHTLTQADLTDSNVRFLLAMSYRIDHFTGRDL
jgi:hypothetical protein